MDADIQARCSAPEWMHTRSLLGRCRINHTAAIASVPCRQFLLVIQILEAPHRSPDAHGGINLQSDCQRVQPGLLERDGEQLCMQAGSLCSRAL